MPNTINIENKNILRKGIQITPKKLEQNNSEDRLKLL